MIVSTKATPGIFWVIHRDGIDILTLAGRHRIATWEGLFCDFSGDAPASAFIF